ncbi:hypothetical protein [Lysinibacillus varians]|uniref:Uncharacterized protein n=1 Tax=Lysinibacillus varians TaxID=1145276 RepID=A0ABY2THI3_9BACI|nr:hypothetical protein [Lysinibacillus varians]AHN21725.1 hypothetical protein T479_10035 [Lysinibacillus varians]TKI67788.1 hypothetical protein FC752_00775 [Lysinibacillus varians]
MKLIQKITSLFAAFLLLSATLSSAAYAHSLVPSAAIKTEEITGTNDLIKANENGVAENDFNIINLPSEFDDGILLKSKGTGEDLKIGVPNNMQLSKPTITESGSYEYKNNGPVDLILQPTEFGVRSIVNIKDSSAPKEYKFELDIPAGHKLISSADYFGDVPGNELDTEEVFIVDENNIIQSVFGKAWAVDANGVDVPTYYEVVDNTLIQTVNFNENTAFPVLADPDWVAIGACSAALVWFVGSNLFVAAKIIKVRNYIKALGGFKESAKLIAGATSWEEKLRVGGSALRSLAAEITGVTGLYACTRFFNK